MLRRQLLATQFLSPKPTSASAMSLAHPQVTFFLTARRRVRSSRALSTTNRSSDPHETGHPSRQTTLECFDYGLLEVLCNDTGATVELAVRVMERLLRIGLPRANPSAEVFPGVLHLAK